MDRPQHETWHNANRGRAFIWKMDARGNWKDEVVNPGAKFTISKEDRLYNMDRAATSELDNFQNGTFVPVRLLDGDEDAHEFASNPNMMGESEMRELFKAHWKTFETKVKEITNLGTLQRMEEIATEVDATVRQMSTLQTRQKDLQPHITEISSTPMDRVGFAERPVSPSGRVV